MNDVCISWGSVLDILSWGFCLPSSPDGFTVCLRPVLNLGLGLGVRRRRHRFILDFFDFFGTALPVGWVGGK